jgi:hypothetical protein
MDGSGVASSADQILILINTLAAFCCRQYVGARIHKRTIEIALPNCCTSALDHDPIRLNRIWLIYFLVMAGLVPAIHVFLAALEVRHGCPGQARA